MHIRRIRQLASLLALSAVAACGSTAVPGTSAPGNDPGENAGAALIQPQDLHARISILAADSLGGRDTPSAGLETAAAYLVSQHRSFGLLPGGESETY